MKTPSKHFLLFAGLTALSLSTLLPAQPPGNIPGLDSVIDRQTEQMQERARERANQRQSETVQNRVVDRVQNRAESVQQQASERAQGQQAENVQQGVLERVQNQAERAQNQAERRQSIPGQDRRDLPGAAGPALQQAAQNASDNASRGVGAAINAAEAPPAALPERLSVNDQNGNPVFVEINIEPDIRAIEYEWAMLLTAEQRQRLDTEAPVLLQFLDETRPFEANDGVLLSFLVPPDLDADEAILDLVPEDLRHLIDRNHIYSPRNDSESAAAPATTLHMPMNPVCSDELGLGIIDSSINSEHPAFQHLRGQNRIISRDFIRQQLHKPSSHGTAISGLLAGDGPQLKPLLPGITLYSAAVVYSQDDYHQGATIIHILEALDWLISEDLHVINISLSGPANRLLEEAIRTAASHGKVVVAAAGNDGPHAPPRYPAAYDGVIAATAVAADKSIYRWANQGAHIDFAAFGVDVPTALSDGSFGHESGTSMAAPVVSAFMACALAANGNNQALALDLLKIQALDLGEPGHDRVFGHGLLHP